LFSSGRRHTRLQGDWSSDVCSSDLCRIKADRHRASVWPALSRPLRKSQKDEFGIVVAPPVDFAKSLRRGDLRLNRLFNDHKRVGGQPPAGACRRECGGRKVLSVRRIEKGQRKRRDRMGFAKLGRVAAKNPRRAAKAERGSVFAQERTRFCAVIDEQRKRRTARQSLDAERTGTREEVEHACSRQRIVE